MKKLLPCLRCDAKWLTTPEMRICSLCKNDQCFDDRYTVKRRRGFGAFESRYASYRDAMGGFEYNPSLARPLNKRNYE